MKLAVRGGGHFARPDPPIEKPYVHRRKIALEDVNTLNYHDYRPENHMHLHSIQVQNGKQGWSLIFIYLALFIFPVWSLGAYFHKKAGNVLQPIIRPGKDHAHMAPKLINHLKEHNFENTPDWLGR